MRKFLKNFLESKDNKTRIIWFLLILANLALRTQFVLEGCSKTELYFPIINNVKKINSFHAPTE